MGMQELEVVGEAETKIFSRAREAQCHGGHGQGDGYSWLAVVLLT